MVLFPFRANTKTSGKQRVYHTKFIHPRLQDNFKKIALAPHDFAKNVYLICLPVVKQSKLIDALP